MGGMNNPFPMAPSPDYRSAGAPLIFTEAAARKVHQLIEEEGNPGLKLRVYISGGGCSGFQYGFDLDQTRAPDDLVIERDGAVVVIDSVSLPYMSGSEIDFVDDLIGQSFQVHNPNATASCGCGTSFSI